MIDGTVLQSIPPVCAVMKHGALTSVAVLPPLPLPSAESVGTVYTWLKNISFFVGFAILCTKGVKLVTRLINIIPTISKFMADMQRDMTEMKTLVNEGVTNHLDHIEDAMERMSLSVDKMSDGFIAHTIDNAKVQTAILTKIEVLMSEK